VSSDGGTLRQAGGPQSGQTAHDDLARQGVLDAIRAGKPITANRLAPDDPAERTVVVAVPVLRPDATGAT
jgi:hypothetical protein